MLVAQASASIALLERGRDDATVVVVAPTAAFDDEVIDVGGEIGQDQLERNLSRVALAPRPELDSDHLATDR